MTNDTASVGEAPRYRKPDESEHEILRDAFEDMCQGGYSTLSSMIKPDRFIFWLERYYGLDHVEVASHTDQCLILRRILPELPA